jgi:ERCC4-type nuclease
MKVILDERETQLYEKCLAMTPPNLSKRVLPLGDVLIAKDDDTILLMIERKTLSDLLSSIKDGRYEEQSYRLLHSSGVSPHNVVYIIEGILSQLRTPQEKKMVYSTIASLQVFKGFSVIRTSSVQETAELILAMSDKIGRDMERGKQPWTSSTKSSTEENVVPEYCSVVKKVKKENITPENIGEIMLCQIPSVSSVSAIAIMQKYKTLAQLIHALEEDPTSLDGITYIHKDKPRKVSKAVIKNIIAYVKGS